MASRVGTMLAPIAQVPENPMRVLYLTNGFPYPLTSGYLRHYHLIRELAAAHDVTLLSLTGPAYRDTDREALLPLVERVEVFGAGAGRGRARNLRRVRRLAGGSHSPGVAAMAATAAALHAERPFDVIVHSGKSTHPVLDRIDLPVAADLCDATSSRLAGAMTYAPAVRRPVLWLQLQRMRRIESGIVGRAAHVMFASERDRELILGARVAPPSSVVPNGVDLDYWHRRTSALGEDRIVFTGAMHYPPNVDAALVLIRDVLPLVRLRVPAARLDVVGRDPAPELMALADRPGVRITGTVPDVRPFLEEAAVFAAPLRFGAGIQNKLLEALAMEVPVVASSLALDGLRVGDRTAPAIVADDPATMADRIAAALMTARADPRPNAEGRAYVDSEFQWAMSGARLSSILRSVAETRP